MQWRGKNTHTHKKCVREHTKQFNEKCVFDEHFLLLFGFCFVFLAKKKVFSLHDLCQTRLCKDIQVISGWHGMTFIERQLQNNM